MSAMIDADAPGRTCSRCNVYKDRDKFDRMAQANSGMHPRCKDCRRTAFKATYIRDGARLREKQRWKHAKHRYGVDQATYDALLTAQGGVCAICRRNQTDSRDARFCIDHDHQTGTVRGLLCTPCNLALGYMQDDHQRLQSAITYLKESQ